MILAKSRGRRYRRSKNRDPGQENTKSNIKVFIPQSDEGALEKRDISPE